MSSEREPRTDPVAGPMEAVVVDNRDPENRGRVKVEIGRMGTGGLESGWARVMQPMAGAGRGFGILPEIGDEVLVGFVGGQADEAVVVGGLHREADPPPYANEDGDNNLRVFRSRSGHEFIYDDTDGAEQILIRDKTGKNLIAFDSADNRISIFADNEIKIEAKSGKVLIKAKEIVLDADQTIKLDAGQSVKVGAGQSVELGGGSGVSFNAPKIDLN